MDKKDDITLEENLLNEDNSLDKEHASDISGTLNHLSEQSGATKREMRRIPSNTKLVTKDTNDIDRIPQELSESPENFEDLKYANGEILFNNPVKTQSKSIDDTVINSSSVKRKVKTKALNSDISQAVRIDPDYKFGLTYAQVDDRFSEGYVNATAKKTGKTYGGIFFTNICTFFNFLTFAVAIALIIAGAEFTQLVFIFIIFANIIIGILQEIRSKRTIDKLSLITAPSAIVIRNGEKMAIPVKEVVLDDILYLELGKQISADSVVVKGEVEVNEAMLTGESEPIKKVKGDILYSGSFVSSGSCYAKVEKVGAANYVESLASQAKKYKKPKSELYDAVRLIIRAVTIMIIPLTVAMLVVGYTTYGGGWDGFSQNIQQTSGAVIGMIPAGMFLLTSTALAVSVIRLGNKQILVQDLYCIEMLARVDVLCFDKTGTITDGTMKVNDVIRINKLETKEYDVKDVIGSLLTATGDNNQTSMALANHFGYSNKLSASSVLPFSSQRKYSAVTFEGAGTFIFGAPEFVLKDMGIRISKIIKENAQNGYRVLVLAHSNQEMVGGKIPATRKAISLIVIEDNIREDAFETIAWFKKNDVKVKVISGDNPITVSEVARRVGVDNAELYISLDGLSDSEVREAAEKYTVFGRVTPEQKRLLVVELKAKGHTVAMTGDGVNDILAMRESDCAVAVATGSDAARNVSHLVLQDSNFTSMPEVVKEGRRVVNNIQKSSSLFLMKTIMSIGLTLIFLLMKKPYPYKTNMVLLLELCVIGLPSFCLALQKNNAIIKGKFLSNVAGRSIPSGIVLISVTLIVYWYIGKYYGAMDDSTQIYQTMLVLSLTLAGYMMLVKICEPFDIFRALLVILVIVLLCIGIFGFSEKSFGIARSALVLQDVLMCTTIVLGSYFVVTALMTILKSLKVVM